VHETLYKFTDFKNLPGVVVNNVIEKYNLDAENIGSFFAEKQLSFMDLVNITKDQ
jgi:hypothetical protein